MVRLKGENASRRGDPKLYFELETTKFTLSSKSINIWKLSTSNYKNETIKNKKLYIEKLLLSMYEILFLLIKYST